jgi:hypothetical protein
MILCEWDAPEGNPDNVAYTCMLSYPNIVSHLRFNFLCLLLLYIIYLCGLTYNECLSRKRLFEYLHLLCRIRSPQIFFLWVIFIEECKRLLFFVLFFRLECVEKRRTNFSVVCLHINGNHRSRKAQKYYHILFTGEAQIGRMAPPVK